MGTNQWGPWQYASTLEYGGTPSPALNIPETTPIFSPDANSGAQEGEAAINAADPFAGVLPQNAVNVFTWE
jgi:hypothetical protein